VIECLVVGFLLGTLSSWLWILFVLSLTTLIPVLYIANLSQRGHVTDFDVFIRQQRNKPYIFIGICSAVALSIIIIFKAPWILVFLCIVALVQTLIMFFINRFWKISAHTASSASFSIVTWQLFGPYGLLAFIIVPIIAWSRVKLHRHSLSQVIMGAFTGALIYFLAFVFFYTKP
jgi:membrane-associated phospholipid phosphatase